MKKIILLLFIIVGCTNYSNNPDLMKSDYDKAVKSIDTTLTVAVTESDVYVFKNESVMYKAGKSIDWLGGILGFALFFLVGLIVGEIINDKSK
jgi:hypothetical protein